MHLLDLELGPCGSESIALPLSLLMLKDNNNPGHYHNHLLKSALSPLQGVTDQGSQKATVRPKYVPVKPLYDVSNRLIATAMVGLQRSSAYLSISGAVRPSYPRRRANVTSA